MRDITARIRRLLYSGLTEALRREAERTDCLWLINKNCMRPQRQIPVSQQLERNSLVTCLLRWNRKDKQTEKKEYYHGM